MTDQAIETIKRIAEKSPFRTAVYLVACPECGHKQMPGYDCVNCNAPIIAVAIARASVAVPPTRHAAPIANEEQRPL
jgi:DNA-directed RNA polymerase subunit RPC12/RpoP